MAKNKPRSFTHNLLFNWGGHSLNLAVMFALSPFVVHTLGPLEYGIWSLVTMLTGYMGLFDLGVRGSTGRYMMFYVGKGQPDKVNETLRTSLALYSWLGVLALIAGVFTGWWFPRWFPETPEQYHLMMLILLPILAANIWFSLVSAVFTSLLAAHERFDLLQIVNLVVLVIRTLATVVVLNGGLGLPGLAAVVVGSNMLAMLISFFLARGVFPQLSHWPPRILPERLNELLRFGVAAFISSVSATIIGQTDLFVAGALINLESVAVYAVGSMLIIQGMGIIEQITRTGFPGIQKASARGDFVESNHLLLRQNRIIIMIGAPLYLGFIVFGAEFLSLWMGENYRSAWVVLAILSGSALVNGFIDGFPSALAASGRVRFNVALAVLEAILNLAISIYLVSVLKWGISGIAAGTLIAKLIVRLLPQPLYTCYRLGISLRTYLFQNVLPGFCVCIAAYVWYSVVFKLMPLDTWLRFFGAVMAAGLLILPISFGLMLRKSERDNIIFGFLQRLGFKSGSVGG